MNSNGDHGDTSHNSAWHSIRPWSPRFVLTVREITSVSATFLLSSTLTVNGHSDPSLASLGLTSASDDDDDDEDTGDDERLISETLGKGLSVNVNGAPWKRVLMRMDEDGDEAIIILFGLMPGRQYDIELGIVFGEGEEVIRGQMTTQPKEEHTTSTPPTADEESSSPPPSSSPPHQHTHQPTIEDRLAQLRHQLSQLAIERELLTQQLKSARKDSQKADASLRSEIDVLKRGAEKYAPAEHRARQKVLALQEAVKQASAAAAETEDLVRKLEEEGGEVTVLVAREREVEVKHKRVEDEAKKSKEACEVKVGNRRKRVESRKAELAGLGNRLEKLVVKKDKLSGETIPDLEEQLRRVRKEVERVERGADEPTSPGSPATSSPSRFGARGVLAPPAPIGSQRPMFRPSILARGSTTPSSSSITSSPPSTLSSRAPPFDPTLRLTHTQQGHGHSRPFASGSLDISALPSAVTTGPQGRVQPQRGMTLDSAARYAGNPSFSSSSGYGLSNPSSENDTQPPSPNTSQTGHAKYAATHASASASGSGSGSGSSAHSSPRTHGSAGASQNASSDAINPIRQSSLPLTMPSFASASSHANATGSGIHVRRNVGAGE